MSQHIEDRLRSALRAEAEGLRLSPDPWHENQLRVAAAASGRSRRVLTVAAVTLAAATLAGGVALLGGGGAGDAPASGTGDPFTTEYLLGPPVEAETLTIDGQETVHTIALSDMTGEGPNLCDQYETVSTTGAGSSGSGGCTTRDTTADDDDVAFDWLTGTEGNGTIRGVTAGVDSRVAKVQIWMDNGDMVLATLHPTGWDDTRMFTLTTQPPDAPTAQRLVAFNSSDNVLQAVDLRAQFGESWIRDNSCNVPENRVLVSDIDTVAVVGPGEARVDRGVTSGGPSSCFSLEETIQGVTVGMDAVVLVVAPEVDRVLLRQGDVTSSSIEQVGTTTPWRILLLKAPGSLGDLDELIAYDTSGQVLASQVVIGLN